MHDLKEQIIGTPADDQNDPYACSLISDFYFFFSFFAELQFIMATAAVQSVAPPILRGSVDECFPDGLAQNGGRIPTERVGFLKPTNVSPSIDKMRQRLKQDGYLFIKGLIPREDVLDMRER